MDSTDVELTGTLTADDPASCTVTFSGDASGTTQADAYGNFSLVTTISSLANFGEVDAQATDGQSQVSNVAADYIDIAAPVLSVSPYINTDGSLVLAGQVSALNPAGLTVTFSGAANATAVTDASGYFYYSASDWTAGTVTAQTADTWGQVSNTVTLAVTPALILTSPGDQVNSVGDSISVAPQAFSPSGGPLTWDITGLPDGLSADPDSSTITGTINPGEDTNSPYLINASVTDAAGNVARIAFNWAVRPELPAGYNAWEAPALPAGQSAPWNADRNWSLGHKPTPDETAYFDSRWSNTPSLLSVAAAAPARVVFGWPGWTSTLTVSGAALGGGPLLTTGELWLLSRDQAGDELVINQNSKVEVTNKITWYGGQISGAGTLLVDHGATATIDGEPVFSWRGDPPTLGCTLQLGAPDGSSTGYLSWSEYPNNPNPALVVTGNGNITTNAGGYIVIENQVLAQGQNVFYAITNGDGGAETLTLNGGGIYCDDKYETQINMGVTMTAGYITAGSVGPGPLHFRGINAAGRGLTMSGGTITDWTGLTFDQGASVTGGLIQEQSDASIITFGQLANTPTSLMEGGDFQLPGTLVAHGGFTMDGGTMETNGYTTSTIKLDDGNVFLLGGGILTVTAKNPETNEITGELTVEGDFEADSGNIVMQVNSSNGTGGLLWVVGDVTLGQGAMMSFSDVSDMPVESTWNDIFEWTGTRNGELTVQPNTWAPQWGASALTVKEPAP